MCEQPLRTLGDRLGIALDRPRPLRSALIDRHRSHAIGDRGHQLHRGGAGADHGHVFALDVDIFVPQRGMQPQAVKVLLPVEMSRQGIVQLADRAHQRA